MNTRKLIKKSQWIILALVCVLVGQGSDAFARSEPGPRGKPSPHHYRNPHPSHYRHSLPAGYLDVIAAGMHYYYHGGHYYRHTSSGYVIVQAPGGAVIETLPYGYKVIQYNERPYYYYNQAYYVREPSGYMVVTPPVPVVTQNAQAVEAPVKTVVINVPNPNGSYIPVTLQKYSDGYVGPNGEHYSEEPTIFQLKAMYAVESSETQLPEPPEELTFKIQHSNGSHTEVTLIKSKNGYVGPEGESYSEKPTLKQLEQMYAK